MAGLARRLQNHFNPKPSALRRQITTSVVGQQLILFAAPFGPPGYSKGRRRDKVVARAAATSSVGFHLSHPLVDLRRSATTLTLIHKTPPTTTLLTLRLVFSSLWIIADKAGWMSTGRHPHTHTQQCRPPRMLENGRGREGGGDDQNLWSLEVMFQVGVVVNMHHSKYWSQVSWQCRSFGGCRLFRRQQIGMSVVRTRHWL